MGKQILLLVAKTIFYFLIIMFLIYLYQYTVMSSAHFIYNEF